ncbi:MAG: UvrD-helicase domain-containing protein [Elusimicrobia bacterium]|nr:UvrD-helicase domain-containing protein [Elusimicrobiota bacterium]
MENRGFKTSEVRVVEASAGSGKTYALAGRYVKLLLSGVAPRSILAITFSNKAAVEMKSRILDLLKRIALDSFRDEKSKKSLYDYLQASGDVRVAAFSALDGILAGYNFLQIQTIDSFINAVLSGCAFRLDISPSFRIKDDFRRYIAYGFDRMVDDAGVPGREREVLLRFLKQYIYLENRKSWIPRKDIISIISGLFEKSNSYGLPLAKYPVEPAELIKKRGDIFSLMLELKPLLSEGINMSTWRTFMEKLTPEAEQSKMERFWKPFSKEELKMRKGERAPAEAEALWGRIKKEISEYCEWSAYSRFNCYVDIFEGVRKNLSSLSRKENVLFLHELNSRLHLLWEEGNVDVPELYYRLATRYRHFLIDEFQDTSVIQWQNLLPMAEEALANGGSLFLVGDRKQGIYRFRGGDTSLMQAVPLSLSRFNVSPDVLNRNYRSGRVIVEFNNQVFSRENLGKFLSALSPQETGGSPQAETVLDIFANAGQQASAGPEIPPGYVSIREECGDDKDACRENICVRTAEIIGEARESGRFGFEDMAVLCRSNSEAGRITASLLERGISVESEKTMNIRDNGLVREIVSLLAFLDSPLDNLSFASFILGRIFPAASGIPAGSLHDFFFRLAGARDRSAGGLYYYREFQKEFPRAWKELFEPFFKNAGLMPLYEMAVDIVSRFSLSANFSEESGFICGLLELIKESEPECRGSAGIFLEWFALLPADRLNLRVPSSGSVKVLTIHKAKGLEFPLVIVPFMEFRFKTGSRGIEGTESFIFEAGKDSAHLVHLASREAFDFSPVLKSLHLREYYGAVGDELCAAYVACTRAVCELHVIIPVTGKANPAAALFPPGGYAAGAPVKYRVNRVLPGGHLPLPPPRYGSWMELLREEFLSGEELKNREAIAEGETLHYLLSAVGSSDGRLSSEEELDAACAFLAEEEKRVGNARKKALALLQSDAAAWIFEGTSGGRRVYCEKEIVLASGRSLRIDRLIEEKDNIVVVDYKSSRAGRERYLDQIKEYIGAVSGIYPGRKVSGVIVYMDELETEAVGGG